MKVEYVFWIIFAFSVGTMIVRIVRNGGWRGAMFGAPIRSTVGEIVLQKRGMAKRRIKIHRLAGNHDGPQVGIEIAFSMPGAFSIFPVSLTAEEARQLATALEQALR